MNFDTVILSAMGTAALIGAGCLLSLYLERRRRRSSPLFFGRIQPPAPARRKRPAPTPATVVELVKEDRGADIRRGYGLTVAERPRFSAPTVTEYERATNHSMF